MERVGQHYQSGDSKADYLLTEDARGLRLACSGLVARRRVNMFALQELHG
jgi:hypothetical protein